VRILHVIHSVDPRGGGPIEGIKQLSAALVVLGHQVDVVSLDAPGTPWPRDLPLPFYPVGSGRPGYGYAPGVVAWLIAHASDYDILLVNGLWQFGGFAVWRAARKTGTPYCVYTHGMLDPWFKRRYPFKHLKKWLYWPWGEYRVLRDAAAVFFTCEEERREARKSFWLYRCRERVSGYGRPPMERRNGHSFCRLSLLLPAKGCFFFWAASMRRKAATCCCARLPMRIPSSIWSWPARLIMLMERPCKSLPPSSASPTT
jgi:glycosyltransferase involved in cell wall biosynthesis